MPHGAAASGGRWPRLAAVAAALAFVCFLFCWVLLAHGIYAQHQLQPAQSNDEVLYAFYGGAIRDGQVPYRDFDVVYPPGSLPAFAVPALFANGQGQEGYNRWFARFMCLCGLACLGAVMLARGPTLAVAFVALSPLLVGSLALSRYDLWPTALVAGALAALLRMRHRLGFALLAVAIASKIFALVLLPLAVVWTLRHAGRAELRRALAWGGAVLAACVLPFLVLAPGGLIHSFGEQAARAIQIESTAGALLMTIAHPPEFISLSSMSIGGNQAWAVVSTLLELVVLAALWVGFARGPATPDRLVRFAAASVLAFVTLGKVLSPQFLIWLVPLVPLVRGRRGLAATALLAGALGATLWYFPLHYHEVVDQHLAWLVLVRDLVLLAALAVLGLPAPRQRFVPAWASRLRTAASSGGALAG